MVAPRRPVLWIAAVALAMVASISLSGYEVDTSSHHALASRHVPKTSAFVSTSPAFVRSVALPSPERRAPRSTGFVLLVPFAAAMALVAFRMLDGTVDQVGHWRIAAIGRRGPPALRLTA
jgi:hypothetical protein